MLLLEFVIVMLTKIYEQDDYVNGNCILPNRLRAEPQKDTPAHTRQ